MTKNEKLLQDMIEWFGEHEQASNDFMNRYGYNLNDNDEYIKYIPWDLLELFGERERALDLISKQTHGAATIVVFANDFEEITPEMEKYFNGRDKFEIYLEW